jgi:hypothetical protein
MKPAVDATLGFIVRLLLTSGLFALLFGSLGFLAAVRRMGTRVLIADYDAVDYAIGVARFSIPVAVITFLCVETLVWFLRSAGCQWRTLKPIFPPLAAILGALYAAALFLQRSDDPGHATSAMLSFAAIAQAYSEMGVKLTMLLTGGAFAGFLASAVHLLAEEYWRDPKGRHDCPPSWLFLIILIGAGFLGSIHGWIGPSQAYRGLIKYHAKRWRSKERPDFPSREAPESANESEQSP